MESLASNTSTGRGPAAAQNLQPVLISARVSFGPRLTLGQQALVDSMTGDTLTVEGRVFTRKELMTAFCGQSIPKDPKVCEALGLNRSFGDFSAMEKRAQASL